MHVDTGGSLRRKTFSNWWKCFFLSKTNHFHVSIVIWSDLKLYIYISIYVTHIPVHKYDISPYFSVDFSRHQAEIFLFFWFFQS